MDKTLVLYHESCFDGFAAAWTARKYFGDNAEFVGAVYGAEPPDVTNRRVLLLDFCYKQEIMERLRTTASTVTVFDHHESQRDLIRHLTTTEPHIWAEFDTERSGASITWDVLFAGHPRPPLLERIADRDLWKFKYDDTRVVHAALESYPMEFATWDKLMLRPLEEFHVEGVRLEALHWSHVHLLLPMTARLMLLAGQWIPVANLPVTLCSDAGIELAKSTPHQWAATYFDSPLGRQFSLRSVPDGPDVSVIAAHYGKRFGTSGGGHPHAAGFLAWRGFEGDSEKLPDARGEHPVDGALIKPT